MRAVLLATLLSITAITLPGCAAVAPATAPVGLPIRMAPGQRIVLPEGATLRYLEVAADSRCPPGVQCIRAGDADVVFEFSDAAQASRRITINTDPPALATLGKWQLRLLGLAFGTAPKVTVRIDAATR